MALTSFRKVDGLADPLKMYQIRMTFGDGVKTVSNIAAKITDKISAGINKALQPANKVLDKIGVGGSLGIGSIMGPNGIILKEDFELRCTSFTYPGATINTADIVLYNHAKKVPTFNDKSGQITVEVVEDMNASVLQAINNWVDVIHNNATGIMTASEFYSTNAAMDICDQNGKSQRRIFLHGVWPTKINPITVSTSSSDAVKVSIEFNYDWYSEINTLL